MITIDIDAPKTCNGCFAAHWPDNTNAFCAIEIDALDKGSDDDVLVYTDISDYMWHDTKPDWCPIKEVKCTKAEPTHGRLIDADALIEYCSNQKSKTISNNDIARFPTVQVDQPTGEWIDKGDYAVCSECGGSSGTQFDGVEPIPLKTNFCPHCRADMRRTEVQNERSDS